ncbi:hypothetical protein OF820_10460 [Oceanotoga sp. DSM 15011]|uniref:glycine betaine ABC transporter substrate-binding protein n=1 Tax=Oceanotoga TaxID=1255275 RepID=UPI0021F4A43C|nr:MULTISPECIES: glycine betaine ABC transporter substrate-binding protein [Oceanotoga]MDN5342521.1 osmoprotectant transport system substrate-binding protein [Oceanotoga sp.]MDO7977479.1 hypothetical protein [Oceanotoga teriensis]UYO99490.1 hypothetical protein OF820_10460 [Oceanotoga sp. DSM 15011]
MKVKIGIKPFNEQRILGNIIGIFLRNNGYDYEIIESEPKLEANINALKNGLIDFYIEYSGTAYNAILNLPIYKVWKEDEVFEDIEKEFKKLDLKVFIKLGYKNDFILAMKNKKEGIKRISDLKDKADNMIFSCPKPYIERQDGLPAIESAYNIKFEKIVSNMPDGMYEDLENERVDIITAFLTDSRIEKNNLYLLEDDKRALPPYEAFILHKSLNTDILNILKRLENKISSENMREMNYEFDFNKIEPEKIAKIFVENNL